MKIKKIISAIAAAAIVCGAVSSQPFNTVTKNTVITADAADSANSGKCGENLTWVVDDNGTLTISGTGKMSDYPTWRYAPFYKYHDQITSIVIEDGVTSIGEYAFSYLTSLENVSISSTVESIGMEAFSDCEKLKKIDIPESVNTLGIGVFENCTALEVINIPSTVKNIGGVAFLNTKWLDNQRAKNPLVVVNGTLVDAQTCKGDVVIPDTVNIISENAFYNCKELTSVVLPDSVTSIETQAFLYSSLKSITIPASVTKFGYNEIFSGLNSLTINGYIPSDAYYYALTEGIDFYDLSSKKLHHNDYCFDAKSGEIYGYKGSDETIIIPSEIEGTAVTKISCRIYPANYPKIKSITVPASVTSIENSAFPACKSLESITILNKDCTFEHSPYNEGPFVYNTMDYVDRELIYKYNGVIYGHEGSTAQKEAEKFGFNFAVIGSKPPVTTTPQVSTTTTTNTTTTTTTTKATTTTTTTTTTSTTTLNSSVLTAKPIISADKITIKESEIPSDRIVNVNINVSGAENCYCYTGIKVYYENLEVDAKNIMFGSAAEKLMRTYALSADNKFVFLTTSGQGDYGKDGVYATIPFILPKTAKAGDKFKIFFKYDDTQMFLDYDRIGQEMQEYALNNTVDGYIEIVGDGSETVGKAGDANNDGEVSLADAVLILQSIASPDKFGENGSDKNHITAQGAVNADVYERGSGLTPQDALQIQKYLSKLITTLE